MRDRDVPQWAGVYTGVPYVLGGAELAGADCYGLVRLVYREQYEIHLPHIDAPGDRFSAAQTAPVIKHAAASRIWQPLQLDVRALKTGDVCLFHIGGHLAHCALYLGARRILSAMEGHLSCLEPLDGPKWGRRWGAVYRHHLLP